jgi:hypothetical protein
MRLARTFLFAIVLLFKLHDQPAKAQDAQSAQNAASGDENYVFPCRAHAENKLKTFRWFWSPKQELRVDITFTNTSNKLPFSCVGEPLELTVPNRQQVVVLQDNWPDGCKPTMTITPAITDSPVADILSMVTKVGGVGYVRAQPLGYQLPPLKNKNLSMTVECELASKYKQTQTVKITYQNPPRISVSAGFVVSAGVKSYGIKTVRTGVGAGGVATTQNSIAVTGNPTAQFVPFSFVNVYWSGTRKLNLSTQLGIGVNPNLSSAKVEFFVAPVALAWKDIYFAPGVHFGQHEVLSGGFSVGDVVTGLSKAPTTWGYRGNFGFSLSYNLKPLVRPSSK